MLTGASSSMGTVISVGSGPGGYSVTLHRSGSYLSKNSLISVSSALPSMTCKQRPISSMAAAPTGVVEASRARWFMVVEYGGSSVYSLTCREFGLSPPLPTDG